MSLCVSINNLIMTRERYRTDIHNIIMKSQSGRDTTIGRAASIYAHIHIKLPLHIHMPNIDLYGLYIGVTRLYMFDTRVQAHL